MVWLRHITLPDQDGSDGVEYGESGSAEETSLSEALEGVRVRDEDDDEVASARLPPLSKAQLALVRRFRGSSPAA